MESLEAILEALLFASGSPLSLDKIQEVLEGVSRHEVRKIIQDLQCRYTGGGIQILEVAGGYMMATRAELHPWVQKLHSSRPAKLSRAALETLALVAFRQPITRAEIEEVRGVSVDGVLRTLFERNLIRIVGRKAVVGRPILYGTTKEFLRYFGFRDLSELPTLKEIEALTAGPGQEGEGRP